MTKPNDTSGPAFPVFPETGTGHGAAFRGLTKREWYAGQAMQGLLVGFLLDADSEQIAQAAIKHADALLKELKK